jgi:hypothetical protein
MNDREFWIDFRRWLKSRIIADQRLVAAIEKRFGICDNTQEKDRRPKPAA